MSLIRAIIADDHQIVLDGLKSILQASTGIQIVGEALNGKELLAMAKSTEADVILFDLDMPDYDGYQAASDLIAQHPEVKLIALTMHGDRESIQKTLQLGVKGYLLKNTGMQEMIEAIKTVHKGEVYYSKQVSDTMLKSYAQTENMQAAPQITPRELEVLQLIAQELTTQQIADRLFIAVNTVETHRKNLHSKLGVKTAVGLIKFAVANKLIA